MPSAELTRWARPRGISAVLSLVAPSLLLAGATLLPRCASAQAHVVENEPVSLYVDANAGSDSNPGTQSRPFRTITAATHLAQAYNVKNVGARILIDPGVYRELVDLEPTWKHTAAPITFEAVTPGTAAIAASDVFTGWYQGTSNNAIYSHPWNYNFGACTAPNGWPGDLSPLVLRREMVFVNGSAMTQVMSLGKMQPGTFYVDESANQINVWPAGGIDINSAKVEIAVRPYTVRINQRSNVVLRGLLLEHASTCIDEDGGNVVGSDNILVDGIQGDWNNWGAFGVHASTNVTIQNSVASHNGGVGFHAVRSRNVLLQFDESEYNYWRGAPGPIDDYGRDGAELSTAPAAFFSRFYALGSRAQGLDPQDQFDMDGRRIAVNHATLSGN